MCVKVYYVGLSDLAQESCSHPDALAHPARSVLLFNLKYALPKRLKSCPCSILITSLFLSLHLYIYTGELCTMGPSTEQMLYFINRGVDASKTISRNTRLSVASQRWNLNCLNNLNLFGYLMYYISNSPPPYETVLPFSRLINHLFHDDFSRPMALQILELITIGVSGVSGSPAVANANPNGHSDTPAQQVVQAYGGFLQRSSYVKFEENSLKATGGANGALPVPVQFVVVPIHKYIDTFPTIVPSNSNLLTYLS